MGLLLYKSDEMFSSTELIRKSKTIFNKIIDKDIEKAIILRDGKPGFLLMDFRKYEKIMAEFEDLKEYVEKLKNEKPTKSKAKKEKKKQTKEEPKKEQKVEIVVKDKKIVEEKIEIKDEEIVQKLDVNTEEEKVVEDIEEEISEEEEINQALKSIESMNFDNEMKKVAEEKIKERIIQARVEREKMKDEREKLEEIERQEELELKEHIEEVKEKKQRELKEFWD